MLLRKTVRDKIKSFCPTKYVGVFHYNLLAENAVLEALRKAHN